MFCDCGCSSTEMLCVSEGGSEGSDIRSFNMYVFPLVSKLPLTNHGGLVVGIVGIAGFDTQSPISLVVSVSGFSTGPPVSLITQVPRDNNTLSASLSSMLSSPITVDVDGISIGSLTPKIS